MNMERPIIFGSEMVKAILEGRKTQTRRVVKPNPSIAPLAECPYGEIEDRLWARETYFVAGTGKIFYRADGEKLTGSWAWRPSIFMHRWASRIDLRITNIRFEQLQAISDSDARAEGVSCDLNCRRPFMELWDSINAKRGYGWDKNPYVWVIEFERIEL